MCVYIYLYIQLYMNQKPIMDTHQKNRKVSKITQKIIIKSQTKKANEEERNKNLSIQKQPKNTKQHSNKNICCSVAQSCPTLCDHMDCSMSGFPALHHLPELAQTHVHWVSDAIQPSHPLSFPSPLAFNLSHHQGFFLTSQLFASGGQSIEASASASVLPMNI